MKRKLDRYVELLACENEKINLVSRRCTREDLERHCEDALVAARWFQFNGNDIVDVGSGGGFPGIPLAIANPSGKFTLVEADLKKSDFLRLVVRELLLENVEVVRERAETFGQCEKGREKFDVAVARAVAGLNILAEFALPLVRVGGVFIAWKGRNYAVEIEEARDALEILGGKVERVRTYVLLESERHLVEIRKVSSTPERFPRRVGVPAKRPLSR